MLTQNILSLHNRVCGGSNDIKITDDNGTALNTSNADYDKMRAEIKELREQMTETNKLIKEMIANGNSAEHVPNSEPALPTGNGTE